MVSPIRTIANSKIEIIICLLTKDNIIRAYKDGIAKEKGMIMTLALIYKLYVFHFVPHPTTDLERRFAEGYKKRWL